MFAVEAQIEAQAVFGQLAAHAIRRPPADILAEVAAAEETQLAAQGDTDVERRRPHEAVDAPAFAGGVDEVADDLRSREAHAGVAEDEEREPGDAPAVGPQVVDEKCQVGAQADAPVDIVRVLCRRRWGQGVQRGQM